MRKAKEFFFRNKILIAFLAITAAGLFFRFYKIEQTVSFGWDQGRDAWVMRDFLQGKWTLKGSKTGIGDFYLGPISDYYFMLNLPVSIWIIAYIVDWLLSAKNVHIRTITFSLLIVFLVFNAYRARQSDQTKGLARQRVDAARSSDLTYKKGDINSYLFQLAKDRGQTP